MLVDEIFGAMPGQLRGELSEECQDNWQGDKSVHLLAVLLGQFRGALVNEIVGGMPGQLRGALVDEIVGAMTGQLAGG